MIRLPDFLEDKVFNAPESSYGVVTVTVVLKDGQRVKDVEISGNCEILKCGGKGEIPFAVDDIVDIEVSENKNRGSS